MRKLLGIWQPIATNLLLKTKKPNGQQPTFFSSLVREDREGKAK